MWIDWILYHYYLFCLFQDKEVNNGAHAPRILALDDYFLMEVEKVEEDPETGKKVKKKASFSSVCFLQRIIRF